MAVQWPATLQQKLNGANFRSEFGETVLRSEMDSGPSKFRRRYTKKIDKIQTSIWVDKNEYTTFENFYDSSLNGGITAFEFDHPITKILTEWRFSRVPRFTYLGGETFQIDMQWEVVP